MIEWIIAPVVGGAIGLFTNALAIRMMFRPHKAKYLFGHQLPFTPGIIPAEKDRLAVSIGQTISKELMNKEVMEHSLLSEDMIGKIRSAIDSFFSTQRLNHETLRSFLCHYLTPEEVSHIATKTGSDLTDQICSRLSDSNVGGSIAHVAVAHVMKKMQHFGSTFGDALKDEGIGRGGGFGDMIGRGIRRLFGQSGADATQQFISALAEPVERALAGHINEILHNNSRDIVGNLIRQESDSLLSQKMCDLLAGREEDILQTREAIINIYAKLIRDELPRILEAVNISGIIEERIKGMDIAEAEEIILEVMDKELNAIILLGGALGFLMGFINCIF